MERLGFGVITRNIDSVSPYQEFLQNAKRFNHSINSLIIAYNDSCDDEIINSLKSYCLVTTLKVGGSGNLLDKLVDSGLTEEESNYLLETPYWEKYGKAAYCKSRNHVTLQALFEDIDVLFSFDTDVYPCIVQDHIMDDIYKFDEIDFTGHHMNVLASEKDAVVSTGDYTGYFIIPHMDFYHLDDLLFGVQKENFEHYIREVHTPVIQPHYGDNVSVTNKIIGGNMAIDLRKFRYIPPFFSATMIYDDECLLGRGEDTLFGPIINHNGGKCYNANIKLYHNTFGNFPVAPDIQEPKIKNRFYYACTGWLIRNPFYNWLHKDYMGENYEINDARRLKRLVLGAEAAAEYFEDKRFLNLPDIFIHARENLNRQIECFHRIMDIWDKLKQKLGKI